MAISYLRNALGGTTTTTSFSITVPATAAGDILILEFTHRGTGNGTIGGTYTGGAFALKHSQTFNVAFSGKTYWSRATGNHSGETVTGTGLTNSCAAILTVYSGTVTSGDPLADATVVGESNATGNETQAAITSLTNGAFIALIVSNSPDLAVTSLSCTSPGTLTARAERLSTGGTDTSVMHASAGKATAGTTGAFTWAQANATSGSWAYAIKPLVIENVTGTIAISQAKQSLAAAGIETFSGIVATTQAVQTFRVVGLESFPGSVALGQAVQTVAAEGTVENTGLSGTVATDQAAQSIGAAGSLSFPGAVALSQAGQALAASGTETFSGTGATDQAAQALVAEGQEDFSGTVVTDQAAQALAATEAEIVVVEILIVQSSFALEASGSVSEAEAPAEAPPVASPARSGPLFLIGLPPEIQQRQRRRGMVGSAQAPQHVAVTGTVIEMIRGGSFTAGGKQATAILGRKSTRARDEKAILELIETEAA